VKKYPFPNPRQTCLLTILLCAVTTAAAVLQDKPTAPQTPPAPCLRRRAEIKTDPWLTGIYFSPDGRLVTQRGRKRLKVWDSSTGELYREYVGNEDRISAVAFSADGSRLAAGDRGSMAWVWSVADGRLLARLQTKHHKEVKELAVSPDGRLLATIGAGGSLWSFKGNTKVKVWDADTGQLRSELTLPYLEDVIFSTLAFSPDGKTLVASLDEQAGLWNPATAQLRTQLVGPAEDDRKTHSHGHNALRDVVFSPDGRLLATLSFYGGSVKLWDGWSGKLVAQLGDGARSLAFSPDGRLLALGGLRKTVNLHDANAGNVVRTFQGDADEFTSVGFSPDARLLAASDAKNTYVWDVATGSLKHKIPNATTATFSPDGHTLATFYKGRLTLWAVSC